MHTELLMGNQAIALGAIHAGVNLVSGYPGTPSTEVLETIAKRNNGKIYVEWSVNEKAALEVAAGAAYAGANVMVTMKQVGLNVASDSLMSLNYVGVKGGMVIVVADDPGPISSQTEQDTRHFAKFAKLPVFDPTSPEEAYEMIGDAFELSRKYHTPVIFRPTTRVCHACASVNVYDEVKENIPEGFIKDSKKWVIFPRLAYMNHIKLEENLVKMGDELSDYRFNTVSGSGKKGIAASGISYAYAKENVSEDEAKLFKVATANPFPEKLALSFLEGLEEVLVLEELDPVIERELTYICGKHNINVTIKGKLSGDTKNAGENSCESVAADIDKFLGRETKEMSDNTLPNLPIRPPVLCPGCPHRASFYAVKRAMHGKKAVFSGDIGCYTLGNAMPLDMVDTCLCMGADVTIAQGLHRIEPDAVNFAFIGDSTFFASGMTGVVNAVYNNTDIVLIVLDNSTTAMTGNQPHPGTGVTVMGDITQKVSIEKILTAMGVDVEIVDPLDLNASIDAVKRKSEQKGVKAIIFRSPCIANKKPDAPLTVNQDKCIKCHKCIRELGCSAIVYNNGMIEIDANLCNGCGLCKQVCPCGAIGGCDNE